MDQDALTSIVVVALIASITVVGCACTYCRQTRFFAVETDEPV